MIHIGLDLHWKHSVFCAIDHRGAVVARGKVESTEGGWSELLRRSGKEEVKVAVEAGTLSWWAVDVARSVGIEPVVVDARHFKLIRESKKKCDRRDAFHLRASACQTTSSVMRESMRIPRVRDPHVDWWRRMVSRPALFAW